MMKRAAKVVAVLAVGVFIMGNTAMVAQAHHGHSTYTVEQTPYCYEDGSCDVDGVCLNGTDCDGTVHHSRTTSVHHSRRGHHSGHCY